MGEETHGFLEMVLFYLSFFFKETDALIYDGEFLFKCLESNVTELILEELIDSLNFFEEYLKYSMVSGFNNSSKSLKGSMSCILLAQFLEQVIFKES